MITSEGRVKFQMYPHFHNNKPPTDQNHMQRRVEKWEGLTVESNESLLGFSRERDGRLFSF